LFHLVELIAFDRLADTFHQSDEEAEVVNRGESVKGELTRTTEVAQVGARVMAAREAVAGLVDWPWVIAKASVA
jgi:hypothetical protein